MVNPLYPKAEQYILIATTSAWYRFPSCNEKKYWLNEGEIAKIGITHTPAERYSQKWLTDNQMAYLIEVKGPLAKVCKAKIERIRYYPFLEENLARPPEKRLYLPMMQACKRLRGGY